MGFKLFNILDSQVSTGAETAKRRRVEADLAQAGPSRAVVKDNSGLAIAPVQHDRAAVQHNRAIFPSLPAGFPPPPAGHEATFATWASCWRECHGSTVLSVQLQLEIGRFVRTVANLPRPVNGKAGEVPPNIAALRARLEQANNNLSTAIDLGDNSDIESKVTGFQIISQAYESASAAHRTEYKRADTNYISQLETAAERVDQLLIREAELAAIAATTSMVGVPTHRTLLDGLPATFVSPDAETSIHRNRISGLSDADSIYRPTFDT
ncbi:hypothetical protein IW145_004806 [Coemansia sp. RSA 521]|nr:hypothetical protein GGH16_001219 [Coemansia sp. RSA 560]KAJ2202241.1 hypothetical protein IW145_004806 [Coemansia sp. RSA 521]KAJ2289128.1 hypothetical protein IW141_004001 [Coemansia sp. RSA 355]